LISYYCLISLPVSLTRPDPVLLKCFEFQFIYLMLFIFVSKIVGLLLFTYDFWNLAGWYVSDKTSNWFRVSKSDNMMRGTLTSYPIRTWGTTEHGLRLVQSYIPLVYRLHNSCVSILQNSHPKSRGLFSLHFRADSVWRDTVT
jgi:hypothetical protein